MGWDRDSGVNRAGRPDSEEKKAGKRDFRTPLVDPRIPNPHSARLQYYNYDVVSVLYTECFTDFSSKERFQHYLIAERRWRFEIESDINSLASKLDEIKSNSANSDSGHSYNIQRLQSIPHDSNSEDVFRCERAIGALEKMMNSSQDITN